MEDRCLLPVSLCLLVYMQLVSISNAHGYRLHARQPFCKTGRKYFENGTCHFCTLNCPDGWTLNTSYIITVGKNGAVDCLPCMPCPDGSFKNQQTAIYGSECLPERNCTEEGQVFERHTDGISESVCGTCLPGYYHAEHIGCIQCTKKVRKRPECKDWFTTTTSKQVPVVTKPIITNPPNYNDEDFGDENNPGKVIGTVVGIVFVPILFVGLMICYTYRRDLRKKFGCADGTPSGQVFGSRSSQRCMVSPDGDLDTDGEGTEGLLQVESYNLTPEEENMCKGIILKESDKYICIVGKKVNRSLENLYKHLDIPDSDIYQITQVWEINEKDISWKVVRILDRWLELSRKGHTLYELYMALKELGYFYILKHLKPIILESLYSH